MLIFGGPMLAIKRREAEIGEADGEAYRGRLEECRVMATRGEEQSAQRDRISDLELGDPFELGRRSRR